MVYRCQQGYRSLHLPLPSSLEHAQFVGLIRRWIENVNPCNAALVLKFHQCPGTETTLVVVDG